MTFNASAEFRLQQVRVNLKPPPPKLAIKTPNLELSKPPFQYGPQQKDSP